MDNTKFACCTLSNGDEWHLEWKREGDLRMVLIPLEKLREKHPASGTDEWHVVLKFGKEFLVGQFYFVSIQFPDVVEAAEEATRQAEIAEWVPPMSVVMGAVHVIRALFLESSLPHGSHEAMDYAGHPDRGDYRGFAALHDRCDANMLLPIGEDTYDPSNEAQAKWLCEVMDEVTRYLILRFDQSPMPAPRQKGGQ